MHTNVCVHALVFSFTTSQMKSLHYDQCFFKIYRSRLTSICVVSSRRNKTNPHHRNKFIPVLYTTHLQAFKPKLSTYDPFWTTDQQDVSFRCIVCICWNIFNRIHFFASCDVVYANDSSFMWYVNTWRAEKSRRSSFDKLFFSSYTIHFTLLVNCSNTVILAEPSLHHNIILEKQDHCWVSRIYVKFLISESYMTSLLYIPSKMRQSFCWFIFSHSAKCFFSSPSFSYLV